MRADMHVLRFLETRLWFAISLGFGDHWLRQTVVNVQEVIQDEVWSITLMSKSTKGTKETRPVTVYVLERTCEVIGYAPLSKHGMDDDNATSIPLRADWSDYISAYVEAPTSDRQLLSSRMKWANREDYDSGIAKLWLSRIGTEGQVGKAKRLVAERYVLACVVGNRCVTRIYAQRKPH